MKKFYAVLFFIFLLIPSGCSPASSAGKMETSALGEMRDFTLKNLQGEAVSLKTVLSQNKAVLVNFWATWCPPCREEIPGLIDMQKKYGDKGFTVLGIDIAEEAENVQEFVGEVGINYPILIDADQSVAESYDVTGIPTSFLVDSQGKILGVYHSYNGQLVSDVEEAIR